MKQLCKRSLALLMVLVMVIGLLPAITIQTNAANYTYNWGTRGTVADEDDFTRSTAEEWYAKYNVTLDELMSYSGSSSTSSVPSSTLYTELKSLMTNAHSYQTSYDATKDLYQYTDCQNGGGKISSFYSGTSIGPGWGEGGSWNREHTWPNSKGLGGQDENDIMMLRPTATSENGDRGNTAYGESGSYYDPNDESNGKYNLHGDCARIVLYVYVRWGNTSYMWGTSGVMESKDVLLKWMEEDPVDTWELGRNDAVQSITGTRNVFVDYPELAFDLFNEDVPAGYDTPSGSASASSYTITAQSNNTSYGTVSVSGKTITASPKTGYYASGYTVTSGSATVTQNGNTFTVNASSDCTVRINFAAKKTVTVSFAGADVASKTGYAGESMTLPTVAAPEGLTFVGWTTSKLSEDTTTKPTYYTNSFTPTASITLYALYSYVDENSGSGTGDYVKVTSAPTDWSGEYVIVYEDSSYIFNGSLTSFDAVSNYKAVTIKNNTIAAADGDAYKFTIAAMDGGYSIQGASGGYIGQASNANGLTTGSTALKNTISLDASGNANIISAGGAYLRFNKASDQNRFRYYKSGSYTNQQPIALYIKDGSAGTTYYTTVDSGECSHSNETAVETPPTLTEMGYTTYYCADCGEELYKEDYTVAYKVDWNMTLSDDLTVNLAVNVNASFAKDTTVTVRFNGADTVYNAAELPEKLSVKVAAAQMADTITLKLTNGGDEVEKQYSVAIYAKEILEGEYDADTKALVQAMLNYGGAAQTYFGYNTENLVSTELGATDVPATTANMTISGSAEGIEFCGATLLHRNKIAVRYYFAVTGDIADYTFTANGTRYEPLRKEGYYYIEVADINPQDWDENISVMVNDALSVSYSPMSYIVRMSQKGSDSLKAMLKAMYNYHLAAENVAEA